MNLAETLALLETLRKTGVKRFKSADFEIDLGAPVGQLAEPSHPTPNPAPHIEPQANEAATAKLKELIGTLNLPDDQLLDKIFPAGAGG